MKFNKKKSKLYIYNNCVMALTFAAFRLAPIVPVWMKFYTALVEPQPQFLDLLKSSVIIIPKMVLDVLNLIWFGKIVAGFVKHFQVSNKEE